MPSQVQLADYEVTGPALDARVLPCLPARQPSRLSGGEATIWLLGPLARTPWDVAKARLEAVGAVRSDYVPSWLEAGIGEWAQRQVIWVSCAGPVAGTLASPPPDVQVADKLRCLAAAARAAHALHEHGQLHGAICPQSVVLLGRRAEQGVASSATGGFAPVPAPHAPRAVLGPPSLADGKQPVAHVGYPPLGYMDPQLLRGEGGRWSDIWGLGATLHYVLAGSPPFPAVEPLPVVQALAQLLAAPAPVLQVAGPLAGLVTACLSLDPLDRPPTARDVAEQLEDAAARW
jgi:hypothetical protein